jgi:uncharacterized protein (UPF0335 family)
MSDGELRQTMQRLMSIHDEIDEKKLDLKTVYADAKSSGFDKAALGLAIRQIRGRAKAETPAAEERASIVELYVSAFDNAPRTYVHVPARGEANSERDSRPAEITAPVVPPSVQSEGEAGARPEQAASESAVGVGVVIPAQDAEFVMQSSAGEAVCTVASDPASAADAPLVIPGLAEANAIAARAVQSDAKRASSGEMPDIPAFLRRAALEARATPGDQA